ncbi:DUF4062 domain-containing protein [Cryptosporangium sp. NPDC051539]|uniref:DUF4062 domain-containing protein n=1 Tax=Cryptosporangium sp. NPDC051539 TaxID=3363962 RepID=UPI0037BD3482
MAGRTVPLRVFLSCTSELAEPRGESFVEAAVRAINRAGHAPHHMQWFGASAGTPVEESERRVRECNLFVGLLGHRYGTEAPGRSGVSYTEAEFDAAVESDIPRLIFIRDGARADRVDERQVAFQAKASDGVFDRFGSLEQLEYRLFAALKKHEEEFDDAWVDRLVRIIRRDPVADAAEAVLSLPAERAALALADAAADDVAEVLDHLATAGNDTWAGTALAAMKHRRAEDILDALGPAPAIRLARRAAAAIAAIATAQAPLLGGPAGPLAHAGPSPRNTSGFVRPFSGGTVTWTPGGAYVLAADIAECFDRHGGAGGVLGFPISGPQAATESPFGTRGNFQEFEGNTNGTGIVYRSEHGAFASWGPVPDHHWDARGELGFPLDDLVVVHGTTKPGYYQRYEGGIVTHSDFAGTQVLRGNIADEHLSNGGGIVFAAGPEEPSPDSPQGTSGVRQRVEVAYGAYEEGFAVRLFERRPKVVRRTSLETMVTALPATVYASDECGTAVLNVQLNGQYGAAGGSGGPLGFPLGPSDSRARWPWVAQWFEGGVLSRNDVVVLGDVFALLRDDPMVVATLGEPRRAEQPIGAPGSGEAIQYFADGVVTVRDGVAEAWFRAQASRR